MSCTNNSRQHLKSQEVKTSDTVKQANKLVYKGNLYPKKDSVVEKSKNLEPNLLGDWVADGTENVTFKIKKNTVYYPEHFSSYKYKIIGDSLRIQYDGFDQSSAYNFDGTNRLILVAADGERSVFSRKQ